MAAFAAAPEIPGFHALSPLGAGPSSSLYSAQSEKLGRWVALAVYGAASMPKAPPREELERFQRAFELTRRLGAHPHAVTLLDWGVSPDGYPYVVTEFYEHGTFETRLTGMQPLPVDKTLRIGIALAGALETAHRARIVHGGVHPARILADADDEPSLADTGLVRLVDPSGTSALLETSNVHAPPEVLEGEALSPATDVFGLASSLHTLLTARPPYQADRPGDTPAMQLLRILRHEAGRLDRPDAPELLVQTLRQALHPDPAQRPSSVLAFAQTLQRVQSELGVATTQPVLLDLAASLTSDPALTAAPAAPAGPTAPAPPAAPVAPAPPAASAPPVPPVAPIAPKGPTTGPGSTSPIPDHHHGPAEPARPPQAYSSDLPATPPPSPPTGMRGVSGVAGVPGMPPVRGREDPAAAGFVPPGPVQPAAAAPTAAPPGDTRAPAAPEYPAAQPKRAFVPYPVPEPRDDPWFGPPAPPTVEAPDVGIPEQPGDGATGPRPATGEPVSAPETEGPAPGSTDKPPSRPVVARGPKALPIIVLGAIVAVLLVGALWMVLSGSDPSDAGDAGTDGDQDGQVEATDD